MDEPAERRAGGEPDMFDDQVVGHLLDVPHHQPRPWLEQGVTSLLSEPACRIVLVTADPGAGKSVLLAALAAAHPRSLRYFLRWDSVRPHRSGDVHSFLEAVGHQLAARFPELQLDADLVVEVEQSVRTVGPAGSVVGVRAEEVLASPFRRTAVRVRQALGSVEGEASGLEVGRLVADLRTMDWRDVQHLALLGPLHALSSRRAEGGCVLLLIDALDESATGLGEWLASCPSLPDNLRIVVTARDGEYLQAIRLRQSAQLRELRIDTEAAEARADVSAFLSAASRGLDLPSGSARGHGQLVMEWATAAAGNFQYAATLISALTNSLRSGDAETARALCAPGAVPPGLRALYTLLISNVRSRYRPQSLRLDDGMAGSAWDDLYAPVLGTLAVARQPVSAAELTLLAGVGISSSRVRDALTDMLHFLDAREGTYRLHHRSFADFLTDPRTERETPGCYFDPAQWNLSAGLASGQAVLNAPGDSKIAGYGRAHACAHFIRAATVTSLDSAARSLLTDLNRLDVLMARIEATGVDAVTDEVRQAAPLLGTGTRFAGDLGRAMDRQRHNLRSSQDHWRPPGFRLQQLHNEAVTEAVTELARAAAAALAPGTPALMLAWSVGNDAHALLRTIAVGTAANALARVDGDRFIAGGGDGSLSMYQASSGELIMRRQVTDSEILAVDWSPHYGIVWGSLGGLAGSWHPDTGTVHELRVPAVGGAPQSLTTYSPVVAMTAMNREELTWFTGGPGSVHAIAVRAEDGEVAIGTRQGAILVIHPGFTDFAAGYPLHAMVVTGLRFSRDSIVACSHDGTVRRTNLQSATVLASAPCPYTALTGLAGDRILATRWDGGSDLIEAAEVTSMAKSGTGMGPATAAGTNPQGWAFIGFMNRRVWVLDDRMAFRASLRGHGGEITAAAGLSAGTLVSASKDRTIRVWDFTDERPTASAPGHDAPVTALLFTEDGLMSGSADASLKIWGPDGDLRDTRDLRSGQIWDLSRGHNGTFAAATQAGRILVGRLDRGVEVVLSGHADEAKAVIILDDARVLSADKSGTVLVWHHQRRRWRARRVGTGLIPGNVNSMVMVDPHHLAVAHGASEISVLDLDTGAARKLSGHELSAYAVAAGPSSTILSGALDGTARAWSASTGQCLRVYRDHAADVSALGALNDHLIVSGAGDGSVHIWDLSDGRTMAIAMLGQPVDRLAIDGHRQRLAVAHPNGGISVLDASRLLQSPH